MTSVEELYKLAKRKHIRIERSLPEGCKGGLAFRFPDLSYLIALGDDSEYSYETYTFKQALAHEMGHCIKNAFRTIETSDEDVAEIEMVANMWAIEKLMPKKEILAVLKDEGNISFKKLSRLFDVSQDFVMMAFAYHGLDIQRKRDGKIIKAPPSKEQWQKDYKQRFLNAKKCNVEIE